MNDKLSTFTDDDLKRLKEYLDSPGRKYWGPGLSGDTTEALLARLEAAEKCLEPSAGDIVPAQRYEAWRKAAGK